MSEFDPSTQIRVLQLNPGDPDSPLSATFEGLTVKPFVPAKTSAFEAISYAWEGQLPTIEFLVDQNSVWISQIVYRILKSFRLTDRPRRLWIDAICIDQTNMAERALQVPLMTQTYRNAESVYVWINEYGHEDEVKAFLTAFDWLYSLNKPVNPDFQGFLRFEEEHTSLNCSHRFKELTSLEWFQRVWVVQEAVLARRLYVHLDHRIMPWDSFASAVLTFLKSSGFFCTDASSLAASYRKALRTHNSIQMLNIGMIVILRNCLNERHANICPWEIVQLCRYRKATDSRDRIYGLMGLFSLEGSSHSDHPQLRVDYNRSVEDVYAGFIFWCMERESNLDVLALQQYDHHYPTKPTRGFPTWVIDWDEDLTSHINPTMELFISRFDNEGHIKASHCPRIRWHGGSLHIKGYVVDTISKRRDFNESLPRLPWSDKRALQLWENEIENSRETPLRKHIYGEQNFSGNDLNNRCIRDYFKDCVTPCLWSAKKPFKLNKSVRTGRAFITDSALLMFTSVYLPNIDYGISPQFKRFKLCALFGGRGLFLLMEQEHTGTHKLISGDCFVNGLEVGKGIEVAQKLGLQEEEFCII